MDVFISWSGDRSKAAAEALHSWLPKIVNALRPWLSASDIDKGARWATDVATRLEAAKVGIICITPGNLHSDWVLFEAGALSKTLQNTYVCPLLIDLQPSDVKGPLAQFQATRATKEEIRRLLKTINSALGDSALPEPHIDEAFEVWWPKLEDQLSTLPREESVQPERADRDILEEILALVRSQVRPSRSESPVPNPASPKRQMLNGIFQAAMKLGIPLQSIAIPHFGPDFMDCRLNLSDGKVVAVRVPLDVAAEKLEQIVASALKGTSPDT
jgi:hypothetical protein